MRGQVSLPFTGFRPAGRVSFPSMGKKPMAQATLSCPFGAIHLEDRRGTAQNGHFVSIFAHPTPSVASRHLPLTRGVGPRSPITGVTPWARQKISGAQNLSGLLPFNPGHWVLGMQKLRLVRFNLCAWLCQANAPGANPGGPVWDQSLREQCGRFHIRRRGGSKTRPKAFPLQGEGGTRSVTDEGDFLACPPAGGPVCRPYGNEGMSQDIAPPDAQLEPRLGASLVSFWATRK